MKWRLKNRKLPAYNAHEPETRGQLPESFDAQQDAAQDDELPVNKSLSRFLESCLQEESSLGLDSPGWNVSPDLTIRDVLGSVPVGVQPPDVQTIVAEEEQEAEVSQHRISLQRIVPDGLSRDDQIRVIQQILAVVRNIADDQAGLSHPVLVVETRSNAVQDAQRAQQLLLSRQRRSFARFKRSTNPSVLTEAMPDNCPICLEELEAGRPVRCLPCSHVLHEECAIGYFKTPGTKVICPICRARINVTRRGYRSINE